MHFFKTLSFYGVLAIAFAISAVNVVHAQTTEEALPEGGTMIVVSGSGGTVEEEERQCLLNEIPGAVLINGIIFAPAQNSFDHLCDEIESEPIILINW